MRFKQPFDCMQQCRLTFGPTSWGHGWWQKSGFFFYVCSIYCASHQFWYFIIAGYRRLLRWISCRRHGRRERSIDIQILGYILDSFCSFPGNFQDLSWWESNLLWSSWDLGSLRSGRFSSLGFAARSCAGHFAFRSPGPGTTSSAWRCFAGWIAPARGWWFATSGGSCAHGIAEVGHSQNSGFTRDSVFRWGHPRKTTRRQEGTKH